MSVTEGLCLSQSVFVADSQCLSEIVSVCADTKYLSAQRQYVSITDIMFLSQTVCVCHGESVSVTDSKCLSKTISVRYNLCLSQTFGVCHTILRLSETVCISYIQFLSNTVILCL